MRLFSQTKASKVLKEDLRQVTERMRFLFTSLAHQKRGVEVTQVSDHCRVLSGVPFFLYNGVFMSRFNDATVEERVSSVVRVFRERKLPGIFCLGPERRSEHLIRALSQNGCSLMTREFDLALDLETFKMPSFFSGQVELEEVLTPIQCGEWVNLFFENFNLLDDFAKPYFLDLIAGRNSLPGVHAKFFLAYKKAQAIGTVALVREGNVTGAYCVSVKREHRSLGTGTLLMASLLKYLRTTDCRYVVGNSNEAGYQIYKKAPTLIHLGETQLYLMK